MSKSIRFMYYCEELFVVKHKSAYGCGSAIFYDMGARTVTQSWEFIYMYDAKVPLTILDGGNDLLLANFHGPRSLKCDTKDGGLAKPCAATHICCSNQRFSV